MAKKKWFFSTFTIVIGYEVLLLFLNMKKSHARKKFETNKEVVADLAYFDDLQKTYYIDRLKTFVG